MGGEVKLPETDEELLVLGRISGVYGVRGWVRVYSYTDPVESILEYGPWFIRQRGEWRPCKLLDGRRHGKGVVVSLEGFADRDQSASLLAADIGVARNRMPAAAPGEYYWTDLEGLRVLTRDGQDLGVVDHLLATGANDVLVVRGSRERLIPFIQGQVVLSVDVAGGELTVDWDPEF